MLRKLIFIRRRVEWFCGGRLFEGVEEDAGEDAGEDGGFEGGVDMEDVREGRVEVLGDGLGECAGAGVGFGDEGGISGVGGIEVWD